MLLLVKSRLTQCVMEKGPLIAGFYELLSRISEYDLFDDIDGFRVSRVTQGHPTGSRTGQNGSKGSRMRPNTVHLRPNEARRTLIQGTWIYPTLPLEHPVAGSGYRVRMTVLPVTG